MGLRGRMKEVQPSNLPSFLLSSNKNIDRLVAQQGWMVGHRLARFHTGNKKMEREWYIREIRVSDEDHDINEVSGAAPPNRSRRDQRALILEWAAKAKKGLKFSPLGPHQCSFDWGHRHNISIARCGCRAALSRTTLGHLR